MNTQIIRVDSRWWQLDADTGALDDAAKGWSDFADSVGSRAENLLSGSETVVDSHWEGEARDSFVEHRRKVVDDLDAIKDEAGDVASNLEEISGLAADYQGQLDTALSTIKGKLPNTVLFGMVAFRVEDDTEKQLVLDAVAESGEIRDAYNSALSPYKSKFDSDPFTAIQQRWANVAVNGGETFDLPPEADGTMVMWVDGTAVIHTGPGDDDVTVHTADDGRTIVEINGVEYSYSADTPITIRTGEGDDTITVDEGADVDLVMSGGAGNDRLIGGGGDDVMLGGSGKDDMLGGDGDDYISGGAGIDYIEGQGGSDRIFGGAGDDTLYGLGENNRIVGGEGDDYIEGGKGDDVIDAGAGDDVISGGRGDDDIRTGGGDNVVYAGQGDDEVQGGSGATTAYAESGDSLNGVDNPIRVEIEDPPSWIEIEGSPEFIERTQADLDMYSASPTGQQMFDGLSENRDPSRWPGEHTLTIRELENDTANFRPNHPSSPGDADPGENGTASRGDESVFGNRDSAIEYNPSFTFDSQNGRPSVVLYHELAHVYSYWNGHVDDNTVPGQTSPNISEHQATGLPTDGTAFDPNDPRANLDPDHPFELTENGLREEMGLPYRQRY